MEEEGEDQQTQPATQPLMDPRRYGRNNSGLSDQDLSDVLCILHPTTPAAIQVVSNLARIAPQHILQNDDLPHVNEDGNDGSQLELADGEQRDIALRMSSSLKDLCLGFCFGRNPFNNDIVLGHDYGTRRISSMHFRIYMKEDIIMLEDTSTNGTSVDHVILMPKTRKPSGTPGAKEFDYGRKRMLNAGSMIRLFSDSSAEEVLFIVRIPSRHGYEEAFVTSLHAYLDRIDTEAYKRQQLAAQAQAAHQAQAEAQERENTVEIGIPQGGRNLFQGTTTPATPNLFSPRRPPPPRPRLPKGWTGGDKYKVIGHAGKGTFAIVYKIATYSNGEVFAAKELDKRKFIKNGILDQKLDNEMQIMKRLRHRNIVQYIDYFEEAQYMYIIMEYVPGGDLGRIINQRGFVEESTVKPLARQVFNALQYLHSCKITHRDIKPDNILIVSEDPIEVKLSDFGLSKVIDDQDTFLRTFCGTLLYCAPEVFARYPEFISGRPMKRRRGDRRTTKPHTYSQACDIWSFAAVLFMALSGTAPFMVETGDRDLMLEKIMTTKLDVTPLLTHGVSQEAITFIQKLLNPRPELRPMEEECLNDAWLVEYDQTIRMDHDNGGLSMIEEGDEDLLDASQLSLEERDTDRQDDESGDPEDDFDLDELVGPNSHQSKRLMTADAYALREPPQISSSPDGSYQDMTRSMFEQSYSHAQEKPKGERLFGEVGQSVVASSGVIPPRRLNLDLSENGGLSVGISEEGPSSSEGQQQRSTTMTNKDGFDNSFDQAAAGELYQSYVSSHAEPAAAASLLGAELLVGQLNVASPPSHKSALSTPQSPLTPKTPASRDASPTASVRRSKEEGGPTADGDNRVAEATKKFVRRVSVPIPDSYYYDAFDKSTHNAEYAAKMRALKDSKDGANANKASPSVSDITKKSAADADHTGDSSARGSMSAPQADSDRRSASAAATNVTGFADDNKKSTSGAKETDQPFTGKEAQIAPSREENAASTNSQQSFVRPLPIHGKLISTPQSIVNLTLTLNQRETSWGRGSANTIVYPNGQDVRIPKYAIDILFWKEGLPDMINKGLNWKDLPDVPAIIRTRASRQIYVNGVALVNRDKEGNPYGKLYTGDVITIWEDSNGGKGELKFTCEFYHGASAPPRPAGARAFEIEHADLGTPSRASESR
ncbi:MAG: hypothetical protein M1837_002593 [Sclerophora amabilis]|nr:MAG: hypothetical protein M1837_002593 [Sclerophora amabilis]